MAKNDIENMKFEDAYKELEKVVNTIEGEKNDLEKSLELFEKGQALVKHCAILLEQAELKIQQLSDDGNLSEFIE